MYMNENLKDQDVLLVKEKGSNELQTASMDNQGKIATAKPDENNPDFLRVDKNGNIIENFYENFVRQVKDPTRFEFFRVPTEKFQEVVQNFQDAFRNPDKLENREFIERHRIDPEANLKKQTQDHLSSKEFAIHPDLVHWEKFERYGISREQLEKSGDFKKMLDYQKTNLIPVSIKFEDETLRSDARFSLRKQEDGTFTPAVHLIRHKPELERPYFGVRFTEEDKQNLLNTGNLGRVVEAEFRQGEKTPILLSLDKQTNELIAFRKESVKIPDNYKGVILNEEQKRDLGEGKAVWIEDMTSTKGTKFTAAVQFNADKRFFELKFDNEQTQGKSQKHDDTQFEVPKTFRKKELTDDQRSSLGEGKTVHISGLEDSKGKKYSGYITLNKETGKTDFMFPKDYKDALAEGKVVPDDRHKTQVAVNSEGKTNEATKDLKEPLKQGQTVPDSKQAEKMEQEKPKKNKGVKI